MNFISNFPIPQNTPLLNADGGAFIGSPRNNSTVPTPIEIAHSARNVELARNAENQVILVL
jgi:hypothetical protein